MLNKFKEILFLLIYNFLCQFILDEHRPGFIAQHKPVTLQRPTIRVVIKFKAVDVLLAVDSAGCGIDVVGDSLIKEQKHFIIRFRNVVVLKQIVGCLQCPTFAFGYVQAVIEIDL